MKLGKAVVWVFPYELTVLNRAVYQRLLYFARSRSVVLVTLDGAEISQEILGEVDGVVRVPGGTGGFFTKRLRFIAGAIWYLLRRHSQVEWVHTFGNFSLLLGAYAKQVLGCSWVADVRDSPERQFRYIGGEGHTGNVFRVLYRVRLAATKWMLRQADVVIAEGMEPTVGLPARLVGEYRVHQERMIVGPNGALVDYTADHRERGDNHSREHRSFRIAYLGTIRRARGIEELVRAVHALRVRFPHEQVQLKLIGPYANQGEREHFRQIFEGGGGFSKWIEATGKLPHSAALTTAASCDVGTCLLPWGMTFEESFPIKMFEYMALGLPIVASDFPSIRQVINHGESGLLVPDLGAGTIASTIGTLVTDSARREALGTAARKRVEAFDWDSINGRIYLETCQQLEGSMSSSS